MFLVRKKVKEGLSFSSDETGRFVALRVNHPSKEGRNEARRLSSLDAMISCNA